MPDGSEIFTPDANTVNRYRTQLSAVLESKVHKSSLIDLGHLPEVYKSLGFADKSLKASGLTILKALGIDGRKDHRVPMETMENLIHLLSDPEAVLKSLTTSNSYVAVLNAKSEKQERIIAILSPSKDGQGFTFIPSVYDKKNFERLFENSLRADKTLYIKNEGSELWGRRQLPPRHNAEPSITNSILTKADIVKRFFEKNQTAEKEKTKKVKRDMDFER